MPEPVTTTDRGAVRGYTTEHGVAFRGIPYAKAPFGPRRFGAPEVPDRWEGERPATESAPTAPQPESGFTLIPEPTIDGGDAPECLSLNVFTPDLGAAGLPVLVWIHGGGFTTGTPSSTWYDGDRFARDGVVVVSVGYRLGAEGFLHIPGAPPNRAVLDWIAALEWVQRNVVAFGGNPARVTVGGQSAGGAASLLLATLPRAKGMFRAALPMSGSVFPAPSEDAALELTRRVAGHLGVTPDRAGLSAVDPVALVAAQTAATAGEGESAVRAGRGLPFSPFVDGELVPVRPMRAVAAGATDGLEVLIGTTAEEFNAMARMAPMDDDAADSALRGMGLDDAGVATYRAGAASPGDAMGQAVTDRTFRVPALRVAEARRAPTYHYEFAWRSPGLGGIGAVHCLDLPFVFDVLHDEHVAVVAGEDPPQGLADEMHAAWVAFVAEGSPGWEPFGEGRETMVFDSTSKLMTDRLGPVRSLWP